MEKSIRHEIDDTFKEIGEFGTYQILIFIFVSLTAFLPAIFSYSYVFIAATPDYRCKLPNYENDTYEITNDYQKRLVEFYIPINIENKVYDRCNLYNQSMIRSNTSVDNNNVIDKYKCDSWVFSKEYYGKTIVTDWKFVCDYQTKKTYFTTLYFTGIYGNFFVGLLSDRFGRKYTANLFIIFNAIFTILIAIILNTDKMSLQIKELIYAVLSFLTGITTNLYSTVVILTVESTGPSYRVLAASSIHYFYIFGEYLLVVLCYIIREYDKFYLVVSGISCVFVLYFWIIPESSRWLISKGKHEDAYDVFKIIAKTNKRKLPEININSTYNQEKSEAVSFIDTIKHIGRSPRLILQTIAVLLNWLVNITIYFGVSLSCEQLAGDPYLNFSLMITVEFIAVIVSQIALQKFGRKIPYLINLYTAGVSLLAVTIISTEVPILITAMVLIGKFTISFTYCCIYIITAEIYPTTIRATTINTCQTLSGIGTMLAPYLTSFGELYWYPLPFLIYGAMAIIASTLSLLFIPESKDMALPETFDGISD